MIIGDVHTLDEVSEQSLKSAAREVGIGEKLAMDRYNALRSVFEKCLRETAGDLFERGFLQQKLCATEYCLQVYAETEIYEKDIS